MHYFIGFVVGFGVSVVVDLLVLLIYKWRASIDREVAQIDKEVRGKIESILSEIDSETKKIGL